MSKLLNRWQQWRARWQRRWLDRRIPPARQITLGTRSLFIPPPRMGLPYLLVLASSSFSVIWKLNMSLCFSTGSSCG